MARSRSYTRKMRAKHIKRKKRITLMHPCFREFPYYNFDGKFSKNKIHCSCCMCRGKDERGRHIITKSEISSKMKMNEELKELDEAGSKMDEYLKTE